jgi:hypothetical protein
MQKSFLLDDLTEEQVAQQPMTPVTEPDAQDAQQPMTTEIEAAMNEAPAFIRGTAGIELRQEPFELELPVTDSPRKRKANEMDEDARFFGLSEKDSNMLEEHELKFVRAVMRFVRDPGTPAPQPGIGQHAFQMQQVKFLKAATRFAIREVGQQTDSPSEMEDEEETVEEEKTKEESSVGSCVAQVGVEVYPSEDEEEECWELKDQRRAEKKFLEDQETFEEEEEKKEEAISDKNVEGTDVEEDRYAEVEEAEETDEDAQGERERVEEEQKENGISYLREHLWRAAMTLAQIQKDLWDHKLNYPKGPITDAQFRQLHTRAEHLYRSLLMGMVVFQTTSEKGEERLCNAMRCLLEQVDDDLEPLRSHVVAALEAHYGLSPKAHYVLAHAEVASSAWSSASRAKVVAALEAHFGNSPYHAEVASSASSRGS